MFYPSAKLVGIAATLSASSSFAGFLVTATKVAVGSLDRYDIVAINTGGDTGTQIKGLEYFYSGSPAFFQVDDVSDPSGGDPDGIPDTVNLLSTSRTRIRVSATRANNVFVGVNPTNGFAQPNPYASGVTSFSGAIANTGITQATGAGFVIARIFVSNSVSFGGTFSGNIGGDIGSKVPFSVQLPHNDDFLPPVITPQDQTLNVVFGTLVANGAVFSTSVSVTDPDNSPVSLTVGPPPAAVRDLAVTGSAGIGPRTFLISGIVDYGANNTDVIIPLTASDGFRFTNGSITLHVSPEPASLVWLGWVACPRRKRWTGRA